METKTLTLSEFLLERIGEDEAVAKAATPGPWEWDGPLPERKPAWATEWVVGSWKRLTPESRSGACVCEISPHIDHQPGTANHIARHDPARVLAECEAKRRIVEIALDAVDSIDNDPGHRSFLSGRVHDGAHILQTLAVTYADHPGYRAEWRVPPVVLPFRCE